MNLFTSKKRGAALVCVTLCAAVLAASLVGCQMKEEPKQETPAPSVSVQDLPELAAPAPDSSAEALETQEVPKESAAGVPDHWLWPLEGKYELSALFGERVHPVTGEVSSHTGVDIETEEGTPVLVSDAGTVEEAAWDKERGNYVLVSHEDGYTSLYGQLKDTAVQVGDAVEQGQVVGTVGKTGMATGAHLHYEVARDGVLRNPIEIVICTGVPLAEESKN